MDLLNVLLENSSIPLYGITLVLALVKYPKYFDTPLRFFPILLMYTVLNEILGAIIRRNDNYSLIFNDFYSNYNIVIYNIYNIVFFLYFIHVFRAYLPKNSQKKTLLVLSGVFLFISAVNPLFQNFMIEAQIGTYVSGAIILIIAITYYFLDLQKLTGQWFHRRDIMCWIGLGMLLFYVGYLPIKIYRYFSAIHLIKEPSYIRQIQLALILMMYCCIIAGFWWMRRRKLIAE